MSRAIEFRAWDKKNEKWVNRGSLAVCLNGIPVALNGTWLEHNLADLILIQFTGFYDKGGAKDYHKDACYYHDDSGKLQIGVIEWEQGGWWLIAIGGDDEGNQNVMLAHADGHVNTGNTYEHPELLEVSP